MGRIYHENDEWEFGDGDNDITLAIYKIRYQPDGSRIAEVVIGPDDAEVAVVCFLTLDGLDRDNSLIFVSDKVLFSYDQECIFFQAFAQYVEGQIPFPDLTPTEFYAMYQRYRRSADANESPD